MKFFRWQTIDYMPRELCLLSFSNTFGADILHGFEKETYALLSDAAFGQ